MGIASKMAATKNAEHWGTYDGSHPTGVFVFVCYQGVTIPSQIRYVRYYGQIICDNLQYESVVLLLQAVELESVPTFSGGVCSESCL